MRQSLILAFIFCGIAINAFSQENILNTIYSSTSGQVSVGTSTPAANYLFSVNGQIITYGSRVLKQSRWPDYVFDKDYNLMPLPELKKYIDTNHHLPGLPDAKTVENSGIDVAEMSGLLLQKTEELTLHLLQLDQRLRAMEKK